MMKESLVKGDQGRVYWGDYFYITQEWSLSYYLTVRGSENFHIYLWIAKDLAWTQNWYWPAMMFGSSALAWCLVLAFNAIRSRCIEEMYMLVALVMWLSANFLWMAGEVFNGDDDYVVPRVGYIMESAISWILFYHVILRPCKIIPHDDAMNKRYENTGLKSRFSYFENWRQYEHAHTLCWLGKDLSWDQLNPYTWILCLIPTVSIAADFIWTCYHTKRMMVDTVHYFSQLMWVFGNMVWALGNIFVNEDGDDSAFLMWHSSASSRAQCRWYASWILFSAYFPLVVLYCIWVPLTFMGEIRPPPPPRSDSIAESNTTSIVEMESAPKDSMSPIIHRPDEEGGN